MSWHFTNPGSSSARSSNIYCSSASSVGQQTGTAFSVKHHDISHPSSLQNWYRWRHHFINIAQIRVTIQVDLWRKVRLYAKQQIKKKTIAYTVLHQHLRFIQTILLRIALRHLPNGHSCFPNLCIYTLTSSPPPKRQKYRHITIAILLLYYGLTQARSETGSWGGVQRQKSVYVCHCQRGGHKLKIID